MQPRSFLRRQVRQGVQVTAVLAMLFGSAVATAAEVQQFQCIPGVNGSTCMIQLSGIVDPDDVLYISNVRDIDEASSGALALGSTGNFHGILFDAQLLPRIYPLADLAGQDAPVITLKTRSISSDTIGIAEGSDVRVTSLATALQLSANVMFAPVILCLLTLLFGGIGLRTTFGADSKALNPWHWSMPVLRVLIVSSALYNVSMSKLPRILIPFIFSSHTYYLLHVGARSFGFWALAMFLAKLDLRSLLLAKRPEGSFRHYGQLPRWLRWTANVGLVAAFVPMLPVFALSLGDINKAAQGVLGAVLLLAVLMRVYQTPWRALQDRSLPSDRLLYAMMLVLCGVILVDRVTYIFFMTGDSVFYARWCYVLAFVAIWYRANAYVQMQKQALTLTKAVRAQLQAEPDLTKHGQRICETLLHFVAVGRVSLLSIKADSAFLAESVGPEAAQVDSSAKPIGPFVKVALDYGPALFVRAGDCQQLNKGLDPHSYSRDTLILTFHRVNGEKTALAFMAHNSQRLKPEQVAPLELAAAAIGLEIGSFLDALVASQKTEYLSSMIRSTAGIVFEVTDVWGRFQTSSAPSKRLIISADGFKTTLVSERIQGSALLEAAMVSYKRTLYAIWFALLEQFEFVSKDVRGDDFWALSPSQFKHPALQAWGAQKTGILLAHLLEVHARKVAHHAAFVGLGVSGAHVAVGQGPCRTLLLGTPSRHCFDIDSPYMPRLHRLRSLAMPGHILIDASDSEVMEAARGVLLLPDDTSHVRIITATDLIKLADLSQLPELLQLYTCSLPPVAAALEAAALSMATQALALTSPDGRYMRRRRTDSWPPADRAA